MPTSTSRLALTKVQALDAVSALRTSIAANADKLDNAALIGQGTRPAASAHKGLWIDAIGDAWFSDGSTWKWLFASAWASVDAGPLVTGADPVPVLSPPGGLSSSPAGYFSAFTAGGVTDGGVKVAAGGIYDIDATFAAGSTLPAAAKIVLYNAAGSSPSVVHDVDNGYAIGCRLYLTAGRVVSVHGIGPSGSTWNLSGLQIVRVRPS